MFEAQLDEALYPISDVRIVTPALAIYVDVLDQNIERIKKVIGNADTWRPHVKTAKLLFSMRRLVEHGVFHVKCATTLELLTACHAGARDVVFAYPAIRAVAKRVAQIAEQFRQVKISSIVENISQVEVWRGAPVSLFVDVNSGMDRTGIDVDRTDSIIAIARRIRDIGIDFRGVHDYEGHHTEPDLAKRTAAAHLGYQKVIDAVSALEAGGLDVEEVITSGTPAFPCALAYEPFRRGRFQHRVSPGTAVYSDTTSLGQLPAVYGLKPAALVVSSVVSQPNKCMVTCDAGHKTVSADTGIPSCFVVGEKHLHPGKPSEEHLPIEVQAEAPVPAIGNLLYLIPRHVCPTVNNFDRALIIQNGCIAAVECVTARGREGPLFPEVAAV